MYPLRSLFVLTGVPTAYDNDEVAAVSKNVNAVWTLFYTTWGHLTSLSHINASFIWVCWELNHCETYLKLPFKQPGMLWLLRWNKLRYQENDQQQRPFRTQMSPRRSWSRASSAGAPANDEAAWPFNHLRTNRSRFSLTNHTRRDPATAHINQADSPKSWSENERTPNTK